MKETLEDIKSIVENHDKTTDETQLKYNDLENKYESLNIKYEDLKEEYDITIQRLGRMRNELTELEQYECVAIYEMEENI